MTSLELARTVCLRLHIVMEEGYLDALFGCEQLFEAETQLSPIIGTGGQYLFSNPSACISETTDLNLLLGTDLASTSAVDTSVSEATPPEAAIVKELAVKVLPSSDARDKDSKTFVVKNLPRSATTGMATFKAFLAGKLGVCGVSEVGYYLRGSKRVWLNSSDELLAVLEDIGAKGRGSIWAVDKGPEDDHESMPKTKKKKSDVVEDRQQRVQARFEELKKKHGTSFTSPQYRFWAEALEVGLHTSVDDPPRGRMFEGTAAKGSKKPNEFKEAITDLAKVITGAMQTGCKTPPLRRSPMKQMDTSPNVSRPLKVAELKSKYIQQVKDLFGLYEVGAISQEDFDQQKALILEQMSSC